MQGDRPGARRQQQVAIANPQDRNVLAAYGKAQAAAGQRSRRSTPSAAPRRRTVRTGNSSPPRAPFSISSAARPRPASYRDALDLQPGEPSIPSNLGMSYVLTGDLKSAETYLRQAAGQPTADSRVRQNLALVVGLQGRFPRPSRSQGASFAATGRCQPRLYPLDDVATEFLVEARHQGCRGGGGSTTSARSGLTQRAAGRAPPSQRSGRAVDTSSPPGQIRRGWRAENASATIVYHPASTRKTPSGIATNRPSGMVRQERREDAGVDDDGLRIVDLRQESVMKLRPMARLAAAVSSRSQVARRRRARSCRRYRRDKARP